MKQTKSLRSFLHVSVIVRL